MAVVTSDFLQAVVTNFRALWEDQFLSAKQAQIRGVLATEVPSSTLQESYNWLGTVPKMRQWVSDRQLSGLSSFTYTITNLHYEASIEVDRDTFEDDKLSLIRPRIQQLALEAVRFEDELTVNALNTGGATLAYDGQNFFSTSHAEEASGTQSNSLTGTGTTIAALRTDYEAARAAMRNFKDGKARPMNIMPTHVVCPPALEGGFRQILNSEFYNAGSVAAAVSNVWKGTAELVVSPYLTDANDWFLLALNEPVKPLVFQMRKPPEFVALDNPQNEQAFLRRRFLYGVDARYNVGYAFWQLAVRTVN